MVEEPKRASVVPVALLKIVAPSKVVEPMKVLPLSVVEADWRMVKVEDALEKMPFVKPMTVEVEL